MGVISDHEDLARELIRYSRLCYDRRLASGSGGNLSVRIPGSDVTLVTASGVSLRDVALENIVAVEKGGAVLEGDHELVAFLLQLRRLRRARGRVVRRGDACPNEQGDRHARRRQRSHRAIIA